MVVRGAPHHQRLVVHLLFPRQWQEGPLHVVVNFASVNVVFGFSWLVVFAMALAIQTTHNALKISVAVNLHAGDSRLACSSVGGSLLCAPLGWDGTPSSFALWRSTTNPTRLACQMPDAKCQTAKCQNAKCQNAKCQMQMRPPPFH